MVEAVPRFEFRAFGQDFGRVEEALRRASPVLGFRESLETYIVSAASDENNTKVRAGLMDIKSLIERRGDLERWRPRLKAEYPLPASRIAAEVFPAFGVATPPLRREAYSLAEYLDEVIRPHPQLAAVSVYKQRQGLEVEGCVAELALVYVNGARLRTVCLESSDPERVAAARERVHLTGVENVNYLIAIKRVIGLAPLPEGAYYRAS